MESASGSSAALATQNIVYDSLCDACWKFFERPGVLETSMITRTHAYYWPTDWPEESAPPTTKIHSGISDMKASARAGCHLCTLILSSFGHWQAELAIPDTSLILAETWRYRDSLGQNMATVCVWPTKTADKDTFFRRFSISRLSSREKNNIMVRRKYNTHGISPESLSQIQEWLGKCCRDHSTCEKSWKLTSKDRSVPTRLIEITKPAGTWRVRVIHGTEVSENTSYATLSHCWGKSSFIHLTMSNQDLYRDNVPMESLPQTFRDAVELTYALGLHHLWIDSLCIIQDSHSDWLYESSKMGSVYAQGHINIAATYSLNGDGGLFNQSRGLSTSPCIFPIADGESMTEAILYEEKVWQREVEETPLGRRAWVVQERVLAPRIVHFSSSQVFWECCQERQAELLPLDSVGENGELKKVTPYPGTSEAEDPDRIWVSDTLFFNMQVHANWACLVEKYSTCSLTVQSDKLVAISGLARRACGQLGLTFDNYVAGLWKSNLIHGLLYRVNRDSSLSPSVFSGRAPSWSWASVNGSIIFFPQDSANLSEWQCASVLDVRIYPEGDGQLVGGSLRIQGPLAEVPLSNLSSEVSRKFDHDPTKFRAGFATVMYFDTQEHEEKDGPVYLLILIIDSKVDEPAIIHGLLLSPTGSKKGQFERVGVMLYAQAEDFELAFRNAKDPTMLDESLYEEADIEKGFTVVII
ncbi:hypothetical protein VTL71DRAFT_2135 [Oculimacula yallundae]|uniref:Heterokaryon incompatibility domain-containing protein n=1 Tax=Oculimacula yallundae TaxID=86028 RepID=A0ABR4C9Z4_9HELO